MLHQIIETYFLLYPRIIQIEKLKLCFHVLTQGDNIQYLYIVQKILFTHLRQFDNSFIQLSSFLALKIMAYHMDRIPLGSTKASCVILAAWNFLKDNFITASGVSALSPEELKLCITTGHHSTASQNSPHALECHSRSSY